MGMFDLGIGGLGKMFKSFMSPEKGYEKGQEQLDKYYNQSQQYLQPYNQQGQEAYGHLHGAMENLLNPTQLHDQWAQAYEPSEYARLNQERALNSGNRAASSMGVLGSTPHLQAQMAGQNQIGAEDQQRYIERMIQQYLQGAGLAQNIYGVGANAGNQMGQNAMNMGGESANMAFGKQNAPGQMFNDLLKTGAYAYTGGGTGGGGSAPWSPMGRK